MKFPIPLDRLAVSFSRSGGPGGQNVNKVSSRVELRFELASAGWIPPRGRARLAELFPSRLTTAGEFRVVSSRFRDQGQNLRDCQEKLSEMILAALKRPRPRIATRPGRSSVERRLREKKQRGQRKKDRAEGSERDSSD